MSQAIDRPRRRYLAACCGLPFLLACRNGIAAQTDITRIVGISWAGVQMLLELGIVPLAIADKAEYLSSHCRPILPVGVNDVGLNDQPNLEALQRLRPELILIDSQQQAYAEQLASIAPLFKIEIYLPASQHPYLRAQQETRRLGEQLGLLLTATRRIQWVDHYLDDVRKRLAQRSPLPPVIVADLHPDGRHLWIYGGNSMLQDVLTRLNLRNGWPGPFGDEGYTPLLGIEQLAELGDILFLYIERENKRVATLDALQHSAIWQHLPFVQHQQVRPLPSFFAMGSLSCAEQFAGELLQVIENGVTQHAL